MDVIGNPIDNQGNSKDKHGNPIELSDYFKSEGIINTDLQREAEYTSLLAESIINRFHSDNIVLSSHLIAFAAFEILCNENPKLDLFGILNVDFDVLTDELKTIGDVLVLGNSKNIHTYLIDEIKVDIVHFEYPWLRNRLEVDGICLAAIEDIAAMKVRAIEDRGAKKDFYDLIVIGMIFVHSFFWGGLLARLLCAG
jgi:hypothetical protein